MVDSEPRGDKAPPSRQTLIDRALFLASVEEKSHIGEVRTGLEALCGPDVRVIDVVSAGLDLYKQKGWLEKAKGAEKDDVVDRYFEQRGTLAGIITQHRLPGGEDNPTYERNLRTTSSGLTYLMDFLIDGTTLLATMEAVGQPI